MEIRHLNITEWQKYKDIRLEFLKTEPQATSFSYEIEVLKDENQWKADLDELFNQESAIFWVAEEDERFVGIVGSIRESSPKQKHIAIVISMFVSATYRGQGLGKKLLGSLLSELEKDESIVKYNLDVTTTQESAVKLYESFGFEKVGLWKKEYFVNGEYYDVHEMEKYL